MNIYTAAQSDKTFSVDVGIGLSEYADILKSFNDLVNIKKPTLATAEDVENFSAKFMNDIIVALPKNTVVENEPNVVCELSGGRKAVFLTPGESVLIKKGSSKAYLGVDAMRTLLVSEKPFDKELESLSNKFEDKDSIEYNAFKWLETGEIGQSSYAMCYWLTTSKVVAKMLEHKGKTKGFNSDPHEFEAHPLDPSDFARCQKFLDAVPGARGRIGEMRKVSESWSNLVDVWGELEDIYKREKNLSSAPELYSKMKSVLESLPKNKP